MFNSGPAISLGATQIVSPPLEFTVVIPLFNKERFVGRAIESVRRQSHERFRVIVVDDGSTDGSGSAALEAFAGDPRFRLLTQANGGVSAARNVGVLAASTEWIAFLDADDEWMPDFLAAVADVVSTSDGLAMVSSAYIEDNPSASVVNEWGYGTDGYVAYDYDFYALWARYGGPPVWSSAVAVRRASFLQTGGFPIGVSLGEDILCWMSLLDTGRRAFIARLLAVSHCDDSGSLTRKPSARSVASHQQLVDKVARLRHPCAGAVREHVNTSHCYFLMRAEASSLLLRHLRTHFWNVPFRTWVRSLLFVIGSTRHVFTSRRPWAAFNRNG